MLPSADAPLSFRSAGDVSRRHDNRRAARRAQRRTLARARRRGGLRAGTARRGPRRSRARSATRFPPPASSTKTDACVELDRVSSARRCCSRSSSRAARIGRSAPRSAGNSRTCNSASIPRDSRSPRSRSIRSTIRRRCCAITARNTARDRTLAAAHRDGLDDSTLLDEFGISSHAREREQLLARRPALHRGASGRIADIVETGELGSDGVLRASARGLRSCEQSVRALQARADRQRRSRSAAAASSGASCCWSSRSFRCSRSCRCRHVGRRPGPLGQAATHRRERGRRGDYEA